MKTIKLKFYFLLTLSILLLNGSSKLVEEVYTPEKHITSSIIVNPCPVETEHNSTIINDFVTSPDWEEGRLETNTNQLTAAQITLLQSPEFNSICNTFNDRFEEALTEKWSNGYLANNLSYYKVGNYYFVIITPRQPEDPNAFVTGLSYIYIFDEELHFVKGYSI